LNTTQPIDYCLAEPADREVLRRMLYEAFAWRPDVSYPPFEEVVHRPDVAHYVDDWPAKVDAGVVASADGTPVGATWYHLLPPHDPGYGFVAPHTPEITIGILAPYRGRGIGTRLLQTLVAHARSQNLPALSLSVEPDNPARTLYERLGFVKVGEEGGSWTMLLELATG
jgi:ribosomal protein S18 acetylase RimI-like enzyme